MKIRAVLFLAAIGLSACRHAEPVKEARPVTSASDYSRLVGQRIELVGVVSHDRVPQVLGVDTPQLESFRGRRMKITGILRQSVVTQAQIEETERQMGGRVAHRGPGTYYRLEDMRYQAQP